MLSTHQIYGVLEERIAASVGMTPGGLGDDAGGAVSIGGNESVPGNERRLVELRDRFAKSDAVRDFLIALNRCASPESILVGRRCNCSQPLLVPWSSSSSFY